MANLLSNLAQDLRYATRQLRRAPAFAAIAIATLALGIGANTAIFSLIDQALLRALPVRDPNELVILEGTGKAWNGHFSNHGGDAEAYFTYPMYKDLRDQSHAFAGLIATAPSDIGYSFQGNAQTDRAEIVSGNYFNVLGVEPALGRVFTQADDTAPGANPVAVLSFDFWRNHLGANPNIVGQQVAINGQPFKIPGFFVPMSMLDRIIPGAGKRLTDHTDKWMNILGRLNAGESRTQAETALAPLWHSLRAEELKSLGHRSSRFADDYLTRSRLHILPGASGFSYQRDDYQKPLFAIMAMAVLVLLIASVNVGSLLLVRAAARVREFSLRSALGARPTRIVQQLVLEGLLIGLGGGIAGMLLAPISPRPSSSRVAPGPAPCSPSAAPWSACRSA
jgi:putative ABC transport system permease protein